MNELKAAAKAETAYRRALGREMVKQGLIPVRILMSSLTPIHLSFFKIKAGGETHGEAIEK